MADLAGDPGRGPKASHALTFTPDHPVGAGQPPPTLLLEQQWQILLVYRQNVKQRDQTKSNPTWRGPNRARA